MSESPISKERGIHMPIDAAVKPSRPGILSEILTEKGMKPATPQFDYLIVLGYGPVIDKETRRKAADVNAKDDDINLHARMSSYVAAELQIAGIVGGIIVTGGRTGGDAYRSEAKAMTDLIRKKYPMIPEDKLTEEGDALQTLDNLAYILNLLHERHPEKMPTLAFLAAGYHTARSREIIKKFAIDDPVMFSAPGVLRYIAGESGDADMQDHLDRYEDIDSDFTGSKNRINWIEFDNISMEDQRAMQPQSAMKARGFYEQLKGTEADGIDRRREAETRWVNGLIFMPGYWVGYMGKVADDKRFSEILDTRVTPDELKALGIDRATMTLNEIREALLQYTDEVPNTKRPEPPVEWGKMSADEIRAEILKASK